MKLSTSLVSVKRITSSVPRSNFNENDLEEASQAILEAEGIINPIILDKTSLESYEVFSGHFEYYAAVRAREIDPRKGEMIGVFILENDKKDAIKRQIELLRSSIKLPAVCTARDNYNKLNLVQKDINQIHEKLEFLIEINTEDGIKKLLTKQLETIISETENKTKQEAIQHLRKAQYELQQYQKNIENEILELSKVNLIDVTYDELAQLMKQEGSSTNQINASWKAIEYWRKPDKELSWDNLKKSTETKSKDKIKGFAKGTYEKLRQVAYL